MEALPRKKVVVFLEKTHKEACIGYLEHLTGDLKDTSAEFHDKLAELYFEKARTDEDTKSKLLQLLNGSLGVIAQVLGVVVGLSAGEGIF